jgi:hypothetical protein
VIVNNFMLLVAVLQIGSGVYGAAAQGQVKLGAVMILVGAANAIVSTIRA